MNICIIGTGYVGLVSGACYSDIGHNVTCIDINKEKIESLNKGIVPIFEPGLEELIKKNVKADRLKFSIEFEQGIQGANIVYLIVGTDPLSNGETDLTYLKEAAKSVAKYLTDYKLIAIKSTVPVGTCRKIKKLITKEAGHSNFDIASNPEFLREGSAISDTFNMERAVFGVETDRAEKLLRKLHEKFKTKVVVTNLESSEMIKYAANAFLATKISFINEIANVCEKVGADVTKVSEGIGLDHRISPFFLNAGIGYGGSCFPKDTSSLVKIAEEVGYDFKIVKDVERVNYEQRFKVIEKLKEAIGGKLKGKRIAVLGLAFKPNTDDMRGAPSIDIIYKLQQCEANIIAYDPIASENAKKIIPNLKTTNSILEAANGAHALIILTEWPEFQDIDLEVLEKIMDNNVIIDGRNVFSISMMKSLDFYYASIGRETIYPKGKKSSQ
ncbi:UDP-glucose 6-dehydrogenase [Lottiidibacillus patelloidae]|uniref:UDP-glucose 6-dehydrogenase n=1 Tax=Lottiidibacillus patelloidae TaxID=2670334 RepID=A0A263BS10_9BACI|nr:UDP-glucose/GDP-mannose dehydrogenase family protein [Lottiidibacillus patelloidae]OZM56511.1 UDP-glucose 6-dehydrogenase [Lottiidibacillus patelloidae]